MFLFNKDQLQRAHEIRLMGEQLIESQHYAVDSIQPKCVELSRIQTVFQDQITTRLETLHKCHDLQERVEAVRYIIISVSYLPFLILELGKILI